MSSILGHEDEAAGSHAGGALDAGAGVGDVVMPVLERRVTWGGGSRGTPDFRWKHLDK